MDGNSEALCTTCAQIIDFYTNGKDRANLALGSHSSLIDTECPHRQWFTSLVPDSLIAEDPVELSLSKRGSSIKLQTNRHDPWSPPRWHQLVYRESTGRGRGRVIDPSWIDERIILEWKDLCSHNHGDACEDPVSLGRITQTQPTWLIDTLDGCLVPGHRGMRYVALSYVRGAAVLFHHERGSTDQLQKPGVLLRGDLTKRLPDTIRDSIAIVPLLGERFLWVDSLCIVHDDATLLQTELDAMSRIYKSSYFTIVAAGGTDANYGLRGFKGLTSPRQAQQPVVPLAGHEMLIAPLRVHGDWDKSNGPYHSRAWTFQEYLFAKRRLIFEHGKVFWECGQCRWDEELIPDMQPSRIGYSWHRPDFLKSTGLFMRISMPDTTYMNSLVSDFNQKAFTFTHDALSAFSGIQSVLGQAFPGGLLYGIPEFFFEAGLMWIPSGMSERRYSTTKSRLETQLPSWSFLGWRGAVNFTPDGEFHAHPSRKAEFMIGISRPITTWYTMNHPLSSERRQIKADWHDYRVRGRKLAKELPGSSPYYPRPPNASSHQSTSETGELKEMETQVQKFLGLSAELPNGWKLHEFGPRAGYNAPGNTMAYSEIDDGPLEYGYRHDSELARYDYVDHPSFGEQYTYYRYPVPVQHEAIQHTLPLQTQFLSCSTSRAFLHGTLNAPADKSSTISHLYLDGNNVGFITLMSQENEGESAKDVKPEDAIFELVAISEGWACWNDGPNKDPRVRYWDRSDRRHCYHVLCIGWEENIAYRRGVGCVLKQTWEDMQEEELVDLILG